MSSGYDEPDVGVHSDDLDDDLADAEDEGFYRGWTARDAAERDCCPHQDSCPTQRPRGVLERLRRVLS